jgi:hypothetical protein
MGRAGRERYEKRFTPSINYDLLMAIYSGVIERAIVSDRASANQASKVLS